MVETSERRAIAEARMGKPFAHKYRLKRLLGIGGMAAVYEASHRNGKRVALKLMHSRFGDSERQRKRFLREAYVANSIDHPGVVQVYDDGIDDTGAPFLVMELLSGETLAAMRKRNGGKLELDVVLDIAHQLLDILAAAHARGVIHRDIKPENLFWETSGRLRVLDFGVARSFEHVPGATVDTQASVLGTPAFMPPEQARGHWAEVDQTSDLWAVGATLFNLITGQFVHGEGTPNEQLGRSMSVPAPSLGTVTADLPPVFVEVVDRALRYEQNERWPDADSMQRALSPLCASRGIAARKHVPPTEEPRTRPGSGFTLATETGSFAASLLAQSRLRHAKVMALLLLGFIAAAGWLATMNASFARGPSSQLDARAAPIVGSAATSAVNNSIKPQSAPNAEVAADPASVASPSSVSAEVERKDDPRLEPQPKGNPDRARQVRAPARPAAPAPSTQSPTAGPQTEPTAPGPAFLDSRF